ncbi:hypothetical protein PGT21_030821 [Puccinia graminis f. sp. tritici]|uniref:Uncharacterized protein n=2 Tax=Puccinia graminis f. sp. tritici TaxID=56615 RepID=A0A5B0NSZ7_PUCGR|nr:hypothetical protein PGTUg99_027966 [Puccinia graminis f. sp. tritici]KAA1091270.1 hypothetical protein PGT21_029843 [Puccinia graminis f. sp. tritici]KAA1110753.1 hypothetical protein PGT21_030821 [Puccinia graminis f. sp. tritici]
MSFGYNVDTNSEPRQLEENHSGQSGRNQEGFISGSSQDGGRAIPQFNRRPSESTQPLRLPSIQLPPHDDFSRSQNQSRFSTCPSLHQHKPGKESSPTTEKMLRKFFARSDDISNGFAYIAPSHTGSSAGGILSDGVSTLRNQDSQAYGSHFRHSSGSHSQQSFQPVAGHSDAHGQSPFMAGAAPKAYTPYAGSSTREDRPNHGEERFWHNTRQTGSSTNVRSSLTESSSNANHFEEGEPDEGELYRCRDCNRKCKSKASYLKHRSMMCTHRLGALTLECRYCKRHYTYAGYLQRHELECAKSNLS